MKYFQCPIKFRNKEYGCGSGPYNGTQAFLDLGMKCPKCYKELKPYRIKRVEKQDIQRKETLDAVNFVEKMFGTDTAKRYAESKGIKA